MALIREGLSRFAGRELLIDEDVYGCALESKPPTEAIARLLQTYGRIDADPGEAIDLYTMQCSLRVNAKDLAVMGATLADGGVNPLTREHVINTDTCRFALAVMATAGLYGPGRLALSSGPARQEWNRRRHRDRSARQGRPRYLFAAAACRRKQRQGAAGGALSLEAARAEHLRLKRRAIMPVASGPCRPVLSCA